MNPTVTRGATNNFQKPENWNDATDGRCGDLQVRMGLFGEREIISLTSTWKPDLRDLDLLNEGGVIEIMLLTPTQPPMSVAVTSPVEPELAAYLPKQDGDDPVRDETPTITINEEAHGHG